MGVTFDYRRANNLCLSCGGDRLGSATQNCPPCRERRAISQAALKASRMERGLCIVCNKRAAANRNRCQFHLDKWTQYTANRYARRATEGVCLRCAGQPLPAFAASTTNCFCEVCYLKKKSRAALGSERHWTDLKQKLIDQDFRCAYTGTLLVLGVNDSADHIYPIYSHPHLRTDLANIEWVTREINEMKRHRSPEQFLSLIRAILKHRG